LTEIVFDCVGARADRFAITPSMTLELRLTETDGQRVDAIALRCQLRIEPFRRRYSAGEAERLHDLFGDTERWGDTLKPIQFANLSTMVPGFTGATTVGLTVPVTYDLEIASTKYFDGLEDGDVPLLLLFSGTIFTTRDGRMNVQQVPWSKESSFALPVAVWRECMNLHFPNSAWLRVDRETLLALQRYKSRNALATWDSVLTDLLGHVEEHQP
jgi:hypothetical protein